MYMRILGVGLGFLLFSTSSPAMADRLLSLSFDDSLDPWKDMAARHVVVPCRFTEGPFVGAGPQWSNAAPLSPAGGGYAAFDGGSCIDLGASDDFFFAAGEDFTIRFWFRSPGIDRGGVAYRHRENVLGWGRYPGTNLDVDFDDPDSGGRGLWTYWSGGGGYSILTSSNTVGQFTDGQWHHYWLTRNQGLMSAWVGDVQGNYTFIGSRSFNQSIGNLAGPNYLGRWASGLESVYGYFGWLGAIDHVAVDDRSCDPFNNTCDQVCTSGCSTGDPHLISFDGLMFDFHGTGDYVLAQGDGIMVQVRQEGWPGMPWFSYNSEAAMKLGATRLGFKLRHNPVLSIEGLPTYLAPGNTKRFTDGQVTRLPGDRIRYEVAWNHGHRAIVEVWRDNLEVRVHPVESAAATVVGLLGVPDGDYHNDLSTRDGRVLPLSVTFDLFNRDFGETWRVRSDETLFDTASPAPQSEDQGGNLNPYSRLSKQRPLDARDLPTAKRVSAEAVCRAQRLSSQAVLDACTLDVAVSGDPDMAVQFRNLGTPRAVLRFASTGGSGVGQAAPDRPIGNTLNGAGSNAGGLGCRISDDDPASNTGLLAAVWLGLAWIARQQMQRRSRSLHATDRQS